MRQTSPTATEPHGKRAEAHGAGAHQRLRDVDRWKDKIEIRLDNRQVAFLFFGSALIACLLFILGVIVGKRLESRGHALAPEIEDPLALLDRVASSVPATATASVSPPSSSSPVARALGQVAISRAHAAPAPAAALIAEAKPAPAAKKAEAPEAPPAPAVEAKILPKAPVVAVAKTKPAPIAVAPPAPAAAAAAPRPLALATVTTVNPAAARPGANPELLPPSSALAAPVPAGAKPTATIGAARTRFMLQVGSFQDRAEAEAFASSFAGERPSVITSEIPGKGTWYRVRVGGYAAFQEAVEAKLSFEKRYSKIALVVGPM